MAIGTSVRAPRERLVASHGTVDLAPARSREAADKQSEENQNHPDQSPKTQVPRILEDTDNGHASHEQCQRGPDIGQVGAFGGQAHAVVRLGLAHGLILGHADSLAAHRALARTAGT